ncbi:MAG: flagellar assembly protein FliH [Thiobacillaceae bacterium]|nr:flagellar assembly protein FliH [Thiobacillaceae bacterium]MCX7672551.1 flagellar assembly protein FliH [Thiobacillaceae bacterium]MDW8322493.1 flagellar assembly protein FliH [Burkholderiales bacterium]
MSGKVIHKEGLTAYQRWELGLLAEPAPEEPGPPPTVEPAAEAAEGTIELPTAEALERLHQQAWQEGHRLGYEEGLRAGYEAGRRQGYEAGSREATRDRERLRGLAEALEVERVRQDEALARELLQLALRIAQQVVRVSLKVKPELILPVVREALTLLPTLSGHTRLVVHPEHAPFVREFLASEHVHLNWKVVEDADLALGGFRVENAASDLDARVQTRWQEVINALGADPSWLE